MNTANEEKHKTSVLNREFLGDFDGSEVDNGDEEGEVEGELGDFVYGRWSDVEHQLFLEGLDLYNTCWTKISDHIKTRNTVQIRTHAQKYFIKLSKMREKNEDKVVYRHHQQQQQQQLHHLQQQKLQQHHQIDSKSSSNWIFAENGPSAGKVSGSVAVKEERAARPPSYADLGGSPSTELTLTTTSSVTSDLTDSSEAGDNRRSKGAKRGRSDGNTSSTGRNVKPHTTNAEPVAAPMPRKPPTANKSYKHLSVTEKYEIVQRVKQHELNAWHSKIKGLQHILATQYNVCQSSIYQLLKRRDEVERDYFAEQRFIAASNAAAAAAAAAPVAVKQEFVPNSNSYYGANYGVSSSHASWSTSGFAATPDVTAADSQRTYPQQYVSSPAAAASQLNPLSGYSAERLAAFDAIMAKFETVVCEQLNVHGVTTFAEAHKYTEWYAAYYDLRALDGEPWHFSEEWFEKFNSMYMRNRFVL